MPPVVPGPFEVVARRRPVDLVQPGTDLPRAPYAAAETSVDDGHAEVALRSGETRLAAVWDGSHMKLTVDDGRHRTTHASRRHGRCERPEALAVSVTGPLVVAWTRVGGAWTARAVLDLAGRDQRGRRELLAVHDEGWSAGLRAEGAERSGTFGQLGLRDLRVVSNADGTPYVGPGGDGPGAPILLSATSAGPGGFRTGHTSVWSLDPAGYVLEHRADLFFRRPDRAGVYGDHATHVVRDGDGWLVATSTWGDFDRLSNPHVDAVVARTTADVTRGTHVLDTVSLRLPTAGPARQLTSVGTWDPHLVRTDDSWMVAYVSATAFFRFHPVLASGPDLDHLELRSASSDRTATEGPTLVRLDDGWRVLASDGRDGPRGQRAAYPVLDLDLVQTGTLAAAYPSNLPWPTVVPHAGEEGDRWLLLGFDGTRAGGPLLGYGTHGDVVVQASKAPPPPVTPASR